MSQQALCQHLLRKHAVPELRQRPSEKLEDYVRRHANGARGLKSWPRELSGVRVFALTPWTQVPSLSDAASGDCAVGSKRAQVLGASADDRGRSGAARHGAKRRRAHREDREDQRVEESCSTKALDLSRVISDHDALVDACVLVALQNGSGSGKYHKKSVLALGSRLSRSQGKIFVQKRGENAAVRLLKSTVWRDLHGVVGDAFFRHLLLETAMFWREGTPTLVQITGPVLSAQLWSAGSDMLSRSAGPDRAKPLPRAVLDRRSMFYAGNFNRRIGLPKTHELNAKDMSARKLAGIIFAPHRSDPGTEKRLTRSAIRQRRVWAGIVLRNHQSCPYGALLRRHCPSVSSSTMKGHHGDGGVLSLAVPASHVSSFLKAVLLRLMGRASPTSERRVRRRLLETVHAFAHLARNATFDLADYAKRIGIGLNHLDWIFTRLIVPLTKVCFYCTEGTGTGASVWYFRKPMWESVCQQELESMQKSGILEAESSGPSIARSEPGVSRLRFVPKANGGLRPIMNCKGINYRLAFVSHALKAAFRNPHRTTHPSRPQMMGLSEFYAVYRDFVLKVASTQDGCGTMHMLTMDIEKCFDNLDQEMVCRAVRELLEQETFVISGYNQVFLTNKVVKRVRMIAHRTIELYAKGIDAGDTEPAFEDIFERARASASTSILIDRAEAWPVDRQEIIRKVAQHIKTNKTRFGSTVFCQRRGIPQGSILSSLLCSICIDFFEAQHMEALLFGEPSLARPKPPADAHTAPSTVAPTLCVRMLDDFLVISPDRNRILAFKREMERGFPEFGIRVKAEKTLLSTVERPSLPWCGLLLNSRDLSVGLDESRLDLRRASACPQLRRLSIREQLRQAAEVILLRADPVLFDRHINPAVVAERNLLIVLRLAKPKLDQAARKACQARLITFIYRLLLSRTKSNSALTRPHVRRIVMAELQQTK